MCDMAVMLPTLRLLLPCSSKSPRPKWEERVCPGHLESVRRGRDWWEVGSSVQEGSKAKLEKMGVLVTGGTAHTGGTRRAWGRTPRGGQLATQSGRRAKPVGPGPVWTPSHWLQSVPSVGEGAHGAPLGGRLSQTARQTF